MARLFGSIQDMSKSLANFSWALSVFGVSQAGKAALDLSTGGASGAAAKGFNEASSAMAGQLGGPDQTLYKAGASAIESSFGLVDRQGAGGAAPPRTDSGPGVQPETPIPPGSTGPPITEVPGRRAEAAPSEAAEAFFPAVTRNAFAEEVFSVYNVGTGTVDQQGTLINLNVNMFDLDGRWVGIQTGTQADYDPPEQVVPLALAVPPAPALPIDSPPVPNPTRVSYTQGVWTFNDGSAIFAQGPSWTHMVPLKNEAFMFMVTTSHVITKGTGLFEGIRGIKQGTGSTYVEPGLVQEGKFPAPGVQFTAKVIDTFRFVRQGFLDTPALGGRSAKVREQKPGGKKR